MSTPTAFNSINLGFPAHISKTNRLKVSSSFLKWNMHGPKNTGKFPVASTTKHRLRYDVSVSQKSHRLNVVSIAKGSENRSSNRFQELYRCCIRLRVFITLYQSNSGLWKSLNFIQLQAMTVLVLNFRFGLDFDNSRIRVQFRNNLTFCKVNIALQTILSLRLCIAPAHD